MKRIIYGESSWFIGDEAAQVVLDYAVALAQHVRSASVDLKVLDDTGVEHTVALLVGPATMMSSEDTASSYPEPDNTEPVAVMRAHLDRLLHPPSASAVPSPGSARYYDEL